LDQAIQNVERQLERTERAIRDEIRTNREEMANAARETRREVTGAVEAMEGKLDRRMESMEKTVDQRLAAIQTDNAARLEQMRQTVDERLQETLEQRLGESFKLVSAQLEQVCKGLGEMQGLAKGVGDLQRVLTNVKARGTWGEVQLERMLEEVLTRDQYEANVATKDGSERVEFAVKLPGRGDDPEEVVWLPIDAKFPIEDYQRLVDAQERVDREAAEQTGKQLEARIKSCARDICQKYLNPPKTTDFGILFLPTEGLFAEVMRRPGLAESIRREHHVIIAGPTTLWSILNALQMGFRTLAIEKRSSEVWRLLGEVKTAFENYGKAIDKGLAKLKQASDTIEEVQKRSGAISRKLKDVQGLPLAGGQRTLLLEVEAIDEPDEPGS
jgi:DNA recombination protein RmuC